MEGTRKGHLPPSTLICLLIRAQAQAVAAVAAAAALGRCLLQAPPIRQGKSGSAAEAAVAAVVVAVAAQLQATAPMPIQN